MLVDKELKVKQLRDRGFSQRAISKATGIPKSTVGDICKRLSKQPEVKKAKILLLDIETAPTLAWVWGRFKQNVEQIKVEIECYVITLDSKWLRLDTVASDFLHFNSEYMENEDDQPIIAFI